MGSIIEAFNLILYEPLFNALIFIYNVIPGKDFGVAIILLTIIIKLILYFPNLSAIKSQKALQETQPKLEVLKRKYKNNREELSRQLMKFYKENKVNPFSSCLPLLIQFPILIALYRVFIGGLTFDPATGLLVTEQLQHLYEPLRVIYEKVAISPLFLGFVDLSKSGNYVLAFMAGAAQFWQSKMMMTKKPPKVEGAKDESKTTAINKQMLYIMPAVTVFFGVTFPAGLTLYWLLSTLFTIAQQCYFFRKPKVKEETP